MRTLRLLVLLTPLAVVPVGPAAQAAGCPVMAVENSVTSGSGLVLAPDQRSIAYGGCVTFANHSLTTVTITVGKAYSRNVPAGGSTSGTDNYVGRTPGTQSVTATAGPAAAHGSITVGAAPQRSTAPSPGSSSPAPAHTSKARPHPRPQPRASASGPQVAPTAARRRTRQSNTQRPPVLPVGPVRTPSPAPTSSTSSEPAVVAGPIEPTSGRGAGLPVALAALAAVGTGAGLARVLLAEPVDGGHIVGGAH